MPTLKQLETALINADKAGDVDAARALAAEIKRVRAQGAPKPTKETGKPSGALGAFGAGIGEAIPRVIGGIIEFFDPQGRKLLTPQQQAAYQRQFAGAREVAPNAFTAGQITGEIAATAPVVGAAGGAIARGGQVLTRVAPRAKTVGRVLQQTGKAIQSSGIGVRAPTRAAVATGAPVAATRGGRIALRVAGGGGAGAATAAMTDQDIVDAAITGAALPLVGTIAKRGMGWTYDLLARRLGETRAAEIMRNLIADNASAVSDALRKAPKNTKANTAEFLAEKGLLTPELAAATRIVGASKASKPLERVAQARAAAQEGDEKMTNLQDKMIRAIARNDFTEVNGATPKSLNDIGWVWANTVIYSAEDKGVFTSLVNAGLAAHNNYKGDDACVTLTEAGFLAYQALAA